MGGLPANRSKFVKEQTRMYRQNRARTVRKLSHRFEGTVNSSQPFVCLIIIMKPGLITSDPEIMGGTPVFRSTRVPLKNLFDYIETGETIEAFLRSFPSVSREQVMSALDLSEQLLINSNELLNEVAA
jgi:uncharacterized protein (DUF433 family)